VGEEPARRADYRSVLRLTERIHQRQFGAVIDAGRIHERLCLEGWLARMAGPGVSDGAEIVTVQLTQMKRGLPYGIPLLFFFKYLKRKTGGARQTPYFCPATKVCKKCLLLAEGISFARFLRHPTTTDLNKPARYRGPSLWCDLQEKSVKTSQSIQLSTNGGALKSLDSCGGNVDSRSIRKIWIEVAALTSQTCPAKRRPFSAYSFWPVKE